MSIYLILALVALAGILMGFWAAVTMDTPAPHNVFGEFLSGFCFFLYRPALVIGIGGIILIAVGGAFLDLIGVVVTVK